MTEPVRIRLRSHLGIRFKFWLDRLQYCGPVSDKKRRWHHTLRRWFGRTLYRSHAFLFRGARRVETASYDNTGGCYIANGVEVEFDGACPVQGRGEVDGYLCYYRSRGEGWQFHVYPSDGEVFDDDVFVYHERRYYWPDGGWVSADVSRRCIAKGVEKFREHQAGGDCD